MGRLVRIIGIVLLLVITSSQTACLYSKKGRVAAAALLLEDVAKAAYKQSDIRIIREGMPAYLMLIDGMVEAWSDNAPLLIAAAQAYASFASVFVDEDKAYTRLLFAKARDYALRSLINRGFKDPLSTPFEEFAIDVQKAGKGDVPYIFWSAACWANWIILNIDSMEALAQLPRVELMMRRTLELDEGFYYGSPHLFMGIWLASRPPIAGGDLKKANEHFLKAIELGKGKVLMTYVYYADAYARRAMDKELFMRNLEKVLQSPADIEPQLTLVNTMAKQKAKVLLEKVDEYFE